MRKSISYTACEQEGKGEEADYKQCNDIWFFFPLSLLYIPSPPKKSENKWAILNVLIVKRMGEKVTWDDLKIIDIIRRSTQKGESEDGSGLISLSGPPYGWIV